MEENMGTGPAGGSGNSALYSLMPLEDFKALVSVDDREANSFQPPSLAAFCLITATFTIEQYCKRRLLRKKHTDYLTFTGPENFTGSGDIFGPHAVKPDFGGTPTGPRALLGGGYIFSLREYPVRKVLSVHADGNHQFDETSRIGRNYFFCLPDEGIHEDIPFSLVLRPPLRLSRKEGAIKVRYSAGYLPGRVPPDLASACLELAAWNMSRYRGRRIGMTGAVRGKGAEGEHLEMSMPENVRGLLEAYRRRVI